MSPLDSAKRLRSELQTRLEALDKNDHFHRELLRDKISQVSKTIIRESVKVSLARDDQSRSYQQTNNPSIKCGLRNVTGGHVPDKARHWYWDGASEKEAKRLQKVSNSVEEFLFIRPSQATVRKLALLGGFKSAVREIGLSALLQVPEAARRVKGQKLLELVEKELNSNNDPLAGLV